MNEIIAEPFNDLRRGCRVAVSDESLFQFIHGQLLPELRLG